MSRIQGPLTTWLQEQEKNKKESVAETWRKMFQYPKTFEERQAIEKEIRDEFERCKNDFDYWYKKYYVKVNF